MFAVAALFGILFLHWTAASVEQEFFHETICDGEPKRRLSCPPRNVISIVWANYGRLHPDTCTEDGQLVNVTCNAHANRVIAMVQESCDEENSCDLEADKASYGDPPECSDVKKYLQVYYLCKPEIKKAHICEFAAPQKVTCPEGQVIDIVSANYGRTDELTCGNELAANINCKATNAHKIVKEKCNGQNSCELEAANEVFGDPCEDTHKYLEVNFHCQAENQLKRTNP